MADESLPFEVVEDEELPFEVVEDTGPNVGQKVGEFLMGKEGDSEDVFDKAMDAAMPYTSGIETVKNVGQTSLESAFDLFSIPQAMVFGPSARLASAASDDKGFMDGLLNPRYIQAMRERNGLPKDFGAAWDEVSKRGKMAQVAFLMHEVLPLKAEPADLGSAHDAIEKTVSSIEDPDLKNVTRAMLRFSYNVGLDPMTYLTFGAIPAVKGSQKASQIAKSAEQELGIAVDFIKSNIGGKSKTIEQIAKEKGLMRLRLPFSGKEIPIVKGENFARTLDEIGSMVEAGTPIRKLSQSSGLETFGDLDRMREMNMALSHSHLNKFESFVKNMPGTKDYDVMKYAENLAEHGAKWGPEAYKSEKLRNLSPAEISEAQQISKFLQRQFVDARKFVKDTTGIEIKSIGRPLPKDRLPNDLIDLNKFKLKMGDDTYNYAYSTAYGFGRKARDEVLAVQEGAQAFDRESAALGLRLNPSSMKQRELKYSNAAADEMMRAKKGLSGPYYDPNTVQTAFDKVSELHQFAGDYGFVKGVKDTYGVTREQIPEFINAAKTRVSQARLNKLSPLKEDLVISKMSPEDFRPIDGKAFDTMKYVTGKDVGMLMPKDLFYPKQVADRVDAMFFRPSKNGLFQFGNWLMGMKSKNILTAPLRVGRQGIDNIARASLAGMPLSAIPNEMALALKESTGKLSKYSDEMRLIPSISETVFDLKDFKGPVRLNRNILQSDEIAGLPQSYMESVHELAKQGKAARFLKAVGKVVQKTLEFPVDNPMSRFVRSVGNSMDVLSKRAAYRHARENGYNAAEAAEFVADTFMDFTRTSGMLKKSRIINPFIGFQMKNLETMVGLAFNSPGLVQTLNPDRGYLKRAIEDAGGWDPRIAREIQREVPVLRDGALSFVLRGNKDLVEDVGEMRKLANQYYMWGLSPEEQQEFMDKGGVMNFRWYDPMQAAGEFLDPSRSNENLFSPLVTGAILGISGYDTFRQKGLESEGGGFEAVDKLQLALKTANPYDYPNFYNLMGKASRQAGAFVYELFSDPFDAQTKEYLKAINEDKYEKITKENKDLGKFMSQAKFLGLGKMNIMEDTFFFHQLALMNKVKKNEGDARDLMRKGDMKGADELLIRAERLRKRMDENMLIFEDAESMLDEAGVNQDTPPFELAPPEDKTGNEEIEVDSGLPFEVEEDSGREPQSVDEPIEGQVSETRELDVDQKKAADLQDDIDDPTGFRRLDVMRRRLVPFQQKMRQGKLSPEEEKRYRILMADFLAETESWKKKMTEGYNPIPGDAGPSGPTGPLDRDMLQQMNPEIPEQTPGLETNDLPERLPASEGR